MNNLANTVADGFIGSYKDFTLRVHTLSEKLSEEQFWTRPFPYGNSFGHLTLHIIGNLNHFIGAGIAKTGYVRDREREFTDQSPPSKDAVLKELDQAVALVIETIRTQTSEDWSINYEAGKTADFVKDRFSVLLRSTTHFHHHLGQMIYLEKQLYENAGK